MSGSTKNPKFYNTARQTQYIIHTLNSLQQNINDCLGGLMLNLFCPEVLLILDSILVLEKQSTQYPKFYIA